MKRRIPAAIRAFFGGGAYYIRGLYRRLTTESVLLYASAIAFNGILCLLPLLLLGTYLLGMILHSSAIAMARVDAMLNALFPAEPYARDLKLWIRRIVDDIVRYRSAFGISGAAVLVWAGSSLFSAMRTVINRIYGIRTKKLVIITMLENAVLVLAAGALFLVANLFTWMITVLQSLIERLPAFSWIDLGSLVHASTFFASYLPAFIMFYLVNRFIPDGGLPSRVALAAALTTSSLWWVAGKAFGWYLSTFHSYGRIYGTYAFLLILLAWIYYSSLSFVLGPIIGQLYRERSTSR